MPSNKEEKNNLDVDEARKIVLDAIGEKKKEKKEEVNSVRNAGISNGVNMKIDGKFLEDVKKSRELLKSKIPDSAKVLEDKTTKPKKEKPDFKEIGTTLDNIAKFGDLKNKQEIKLENEIKTKRPGKKEERIKEKIGGKEKQETAKSEPAEKKQKKRK